MFCPFSNVVRLSSSVAILSGVAQGNVRRSFSSVGYDRQYCVAFANLIIPECDMKIGYRPGKSHQNPNCLSRIPKNLGAIPKTQNKGGVIAAMMFTPRKEAQAATGSVHVDTPGTNEIQK